MSAFDDEFGLFGDEEKQAEEERTSTLGARRIASDEAAHDDIEPEDERPRREPRRDRSGASDAQRDGGGSGGGDWRPRREYGGDRGARKTADPVVAQQRALDLLGFLARKLVAKPDSVLVEEVDTDKGPVVELVVEHDDLGKVIGRSGRVAQALRTLVRASAEGRISIDIISFEDEVVEGEAEHAGSANVATDDDADVAAAAQRTTATADDDDADSVGTVASSDAEPDEAGAVKGKAKAGKAKAATAKAGAVKTPRTTATAAKATAAKAGAKKSAPAKATAAKAKSARSKATGDDAAE